MTRREDSPTDTAARQLADRQLIDRQLSGRELAAEVIAGLSRDASLDDVLRALGFQRMVRRGLDQLAAGDTVDHDELRRRLRSWPS